MSQKNIAKLVICLVLMLCVQASVFGICFTPYNITSNNGSTSSFTITWSDFSSDAIAYQTILVPHGTIPTFDVYQESSTKEKTYNALDAGKSYDFYIRTRCANGFSNWSNAQTFTTHLENVSLCDLNLQIDDDRCDSPNSYFLEVENITGNLGSSTFIQKINLFAEHSWPSDLTIKLKSPSGQECVLIQDRGIGQTNLGLIDDTCNEPLSFTSAACQMISDGGIPLVGNFQPETPIEVFYNNSNPNGTWEIILCDKAEDQIGTLKGFEIIFDDAVCSGPSDLYFQDIGHNQANIIIPPAFCDSIQVEYKAVSNGVLKTVITHCNGDTLFLEELDASETYEINYQILCGLDYTSISCPMSFETSCSPVSLLEDFDDQLNCASNCNTECNLSQIWRTNPVHSRWNITNTESGSDLTGPMEDFSGIGKYIYAEAVQSDCYIDSTILESSCLFIDSEGDCDLQFQTYMFGADVDSLVLRIRNDDHLNGVTLWNLSGNQGNQWNNHIVSLDAYHGTYATLYFIAYFRKGDFGDIAIDEIKFHGSTVTNEKGFVYYVDEDLDGFGSRTDSIFYCGINVPTGYSNTFNDCDDTNPNIHPNADELGCNLLDDNCNGEIDEVNNNFTLLYSIDSLAHENCFGSQDGFVELSASGGVEPYIFTWEDGITSSVRSDLTKGTYRVTVEDASGCKTITEDINIQVIQNFPGISFVYDTVSCFGIADGGIQVVPPLTGAPHTLQWSNNESGPQINNVTSGMYTLTLTDINGCNVEIDFNLPAHTKLDLSAENLTKPSCFNGTDGSIQVNTSGGEGPYEYLWENGSEESVISNIGAGNYSVTSMDINGCMVIDSFTLKEPKKLDFNINEIRSNTCFGSNNGFISVLPKGGTPPYSITWSDGSEDLMNMNLAAGNYQFTLQDKNDCMVQSEMIEITEPEPLLVTNTEINPSYCSSDSTGSIALDVSGGRGNYQYFWSNNQLESQINQLSSDHYNVTIIDEYNCKLTVDSIYVPNVTFSPSLSATQVSESQCFGDSTAVIEASLDSVLQNNITWEINNNPIQSNQLNYSFMNLGIGEYLISAKDGFGCFSDTVQIYIESPDSISYSIDSVQQLTCPFGQDGRIDISVTGGTIPYSYLWNNGDTTLSIQGLSAGEYILTITDANQCSFTTAPIEIDSIDSLNHSIVIIEHNLCHDDQTGKIEIDVEGGTSPYEYQWNNNETSAEIQNLPAGDYICSVTDFNGCSYVTPKITVLAPDSIGYSEEITNNKCYDDQSGKIELNVYGGTGTYAFNWNHGDSLSSISDLAEGYYYAEIVDQNGCSISTDSIYISQPIPITYEIDSIMINTCFGDHNGSILMSTFGGTSPYSYSWNNQDSVEDISSLPIGDYQCTIKDQNECEITTELITVTQADSLYYVIDSISPISCYGESDGYISIKPNGGFGNYTFKWVDGETSLSKSNITAGTYAFELSDDGDCPSIMDTVILLEPSPITVHNIETKNAICTASNGELDIDISGGNGMYFYYLNESFITANQLDSLGEGNYHFYIKDQKDCTSDTLIFDIESTYQDPQLSLLQVSNTHCSDTEDGTIKVLAEQPNVIPPYIWTFDNEMSTTEGPTFLRNQLSAGNYELYFEDGYGCRDTLKNLTIFSPEPIQYIVDSLQDNTCHNSLDGYIAIHASGGTGTYTYSWDNEENTSTIDSLVNLQYTCIITDENDCQISTETFSISQPDSLYLIASVEDSEAGKMNGSIDITVYGGQPDYSFTWKEPLDSGQEDQLNLGKGSYFLIIEDELGCTLDTVFYINEYVHVGEIDNLQSLHIFPNPTKGEVTIISQESLQSIELIHTLGTREELPFEESTEGTYTIDLTNFPSGIYWLICQNKNKQIQVRKLIKI